MLFGKEERWLVKEKGLCFLFMLRVPQEPSQYIHTHTHESQEDYGKENELIEPDGSGSTPRRPLGWMNLHL